MNEDKLAAKRKVYSWKVCLDCGNNGPEPWHTFHTKTGNLNGLLCDKCFKKRKEAE